MSKEADCRTAPATPGLLNIKGKEKTYPSVGRNLCFSHEIIPSYKRVGLQIQMLSRLARPYKNCVSGAVRYPGFKNVVHEYEHTENTENCTKLVKTFNNKKV